MKASRADMVDIDGHIIPTKLRFDMPAESSHTNVTVRYVRAEALDATLFTVSALERKPDLRRILRRGSRNGDE